MLLPKTVETAVVPLPFFATYARDAEVDVLVRPRREAAVGAGAHDTLACPLDARVEREQLEKRGLCPAGYFNASAAPVLCDLRDLAREDDKCLLRVGVCPARTSYAPALELEGAKTGFGNELDLSRR